MAKDYDMKSRHAAWCFCVANHYKTNQQPTIYSPQLKQIAIRTLQTTPEGYRPTREAIRLNEQVAYVKKVIRGNCYTYRRKRKYNMTPGLALTSGNEGGI